MSQSQVTPLTIGKLQKALLTNHPLWEKRLVDYFTHNGTGRSGSIFETIGGRGDAPAIANQMTYTDCFSVTCLTVKVPPLAAHKMVEGKSSQTIKGFLSKLPVGVVLNATKWRQYASVVEALQDFLKSKEHEDVGWVTAAKLIARKRPDLVPILDNVVWHALGLTSESASAGWEFIADAVTDAVIVCQLKTIQSRAVAVIAKGGFPNALNTSAIAGLPLHRVLDILVWEEHKCHYVNFDASKVKRAVNAQKQRQHRCPF